MEQRLKDLNTEAASPRYHQYPLHWKEAIKQERELLNVKLGLHANTRPIISNPQHHHYSQSQSQKSYQPENPSHVLRRAIQSGEQGPPIGFMGQYANQVDSPTGGWKQGPPIGFMGGYGTQYNDGRREQGYVPPMVNSQQKGPCDVPEYMRPLVPPPPDPEPPYVPPRCTQQLGPQPPQQPNSSSHRGNQRRHHRQ
jgi:hypothetical protein